jgi:hypothetical protein
MTEPSPERTCMPGCQPGAKGTVRQGPASATGESVYVVAMDEENSGFPCYFLEDEAELAVRARPQHPPRHPGTHSIPAGAADIQSGCASTDDADPHAHPRLPSGGRRRTAALATGSPSCATSKVSLPWQSAGAPPILYISVNI